MSAPRPRLATEVADIRNAIKRSLQGTASHEVTVACSGGPDSLVLAVETAFVADKLDRDVTTVIIDHGLQAGSDDVAERTAAVLARRGIETRIERAEVGRTPSGLEADARAARYRVLDACTGPVLLGHTLDDQAETVLLGLARGSGTRALAGMRPERGKFLRPLLGITRAQIVSAADAEDLRPWHDPMNDDLSYARVRARRTVLPLLEEQLGPGIAAALARSAEQLGADADALDDLSDALYDGAVPGGDAVPSVKSRADAGKSLALDVRELGGASAAVRRRVLLRAAIAAGATKQAVARVHIAELERLAGRQAGTIAVSLPGGLSATREGPYLTIRTVDGDSPGHDIK